MKGVYSSLPRIFLASSSKKDSLNNLKSKGMSDASLRYLFLFYFAEEPVD